MIQNTKEQEIQTRITRFKKFRRKERWSRLNSVQTQFVHMAQGGDGTAAMEGEIRQTYYPTWTTADFQRVCDEMGWEY